VRIIAACAIVSMLASSAVAADCRTQGTAVISSMAANMIVLDRLEAAYKALPPKTPASDPRVQAIVSEWCPALEDFFNNLERLAQIDESSRCTHWRSELSPEETAAMRSMVTSTGSLAILRRALFCKPH
jgi:hypothetical protein